MALTRKLLKGMSLTDEQTETIIEAHTDTLDGLKGRIAELEKQNKEVAALQKELEQAQEAAKDGGWKEKYNALKKDFEEHKADIAAKELKTAKEKAVRAYLESRKISGKNLEIAMKALHAEIEAVELEGENIKDKKPLDEMISGDLSGLVTTTTVQGAPPPANPPVNTGGGTLTREDILKIKDTTERQRAWAELIKSQQKGS